MRLLNSHSLLIFSFVVLTGCSTTKGIPEGDKLYTGADIDLNTAGLTAREAKVLRADLKGLVKPRANTKFFGMPVKLQIYNFFHKAKPKSIFGRLRNKLGEPPVLLSAVDLENNEKLLDGHLENKGFFRAKVTSDTVIRRKTARARFNAVPGPQYHISSVVFENDSSVLGRAIIESTKATLLKKDDPYDLDVIKGERRRIDAFLKERGFYYFNADNLIIRVDSTPGNHKVNMRVVVKPNTAPDALHPYTIRDITIYSNYNLTTASIDTNLSNRTAYEDYFVVDEKKRFKPKMFTQALQFKRGDVYNRTAHNQTLNRLINLNVYKFVKNRFQKVSDSTQLDVYYYLTPHPPKSLRAEFNVTTKTNNLNGSQVSGTWLHRNLFRAGEQLSLTAYVGSEIQFGANTAGNNTYRSGAELNFAVPRFFIPFADIRTRGGYIPRTNVQLGYDILQKQNYYTLNQYRFAYGYLWQQSQAARHEFYPVSISYVQPLNVTQQFRDSIAKYQFLQHVVDSQFILGSTYQYTYNEVTAGLQKNNSFFFNGIIDVSGNVAGLIAKPTNVGDPKKRILDKAFDQFIKLEADLRFYRRIGLKSSFANRIIIGLGIPYGNSEQLPYIKQFFSGGNNSVRAFRSRSLLGTYAFPDTTGFLPDLTGDLKFEFNTEFRPHLSGPLYGALFIDAGNTWLQKEDTTRPGSGFKKDFLNELGVGLGFGFRLDIQLFVIRFDIAFPLRKPWEQNPWVINQIALGNSKWRRDNLVFNLAIGYPF